MDKHEILYAYHLMAHVRPSMVLLYDLTLYVAHIYIIHIYIHVYMYITI